jgi:hypothetical protein
MIRTNESTVGRNVMHTEQTDLNPKSVVSTGSLEIKLPEISRDIDRETYRTKVCLSSTLPIAQVHHLGGSKSQHQ